MARRHVRTQPRGVYVFSVVPSPLVGEGGRRPGEGWGSARPLTPAPSPTAGRGEKAAAQWGPALTALAVAAILAAAGCVKVKDHLTLSADGSGTVHLEAVSLLPQQAMAAAGRGGEGFSIYPPTSPHELDALFPEKDFEVKEYFRLDETEGPALVADIKFKDVNKLIASDYGKAHSLRLVREGGELVLKARTGVQAVGRFDLQAFAATAGEGPPPELMKGMTEASAKLAAEFKITMPAAVKVEGAGATAEGSTAIWSADRATIKDAAAAAEAFDVILTVRCPDAGVTFKPVPVARLDLEPFKDLKDAKLTEAAAVDIEKVKAAARFVPVMLRVTRSFNLAGEGFQSENSAVLTGAIVIPMALAPVHWGEAVLIEARDDRGTNLVPAKAEGYEYHYRQRMFSRSSSFPGVEGDEEEPGAAKKLPDPDVLQELSFALNVPPPDAARIVLLKGSETLEYAGARHVVRLEGAIAKEVIPEVGPNRMMMSLGSATKPLAAPKLEALGVKLTVSASRGGGMTMVEIVTGLDASPVAEVQVFDAAGRPWPTLPASIMNRGEDEGGSRRFFVVGNPEGPLSLGLVLSAPGKSLVLPIELRDIPMTRDASAPPAAKPAETPKPDSKADEIPKAAPAPAPAAK